MEIEVYKLEQLGLGKGPYRIVGFYQMPAPSMADQNPTAYNNALRNMPVGVGCGMCGICGIGLVNNYIIQSSDGKKTAVGCDCVKKINIRSLMSQVKEIQKKLRQEKKEAERQAKINAREARLQEEREKNGGLTNYEVDRQKREAEIKAKQAPKIEALAPFVRELADGRGGFRDSIAEGMKLGRIPEGRGLDITIEILAKNAGRAGSKAYKARMAEVEKILEQIDNGIYGA